MDSINNKKLDTGYLQEEELKLTPQENYIPKDIIIVILSNLETLNLRQTVSVSKQWKILTMISFNTEQLSKTKNFADFLSKNLTEEHYEEQINNLIEISRTKYFEYGNINQSRKSTIKLKKEIFDILKTVNEEDLKKLEELSKDIEKPELFENIFKILDFHKTVDKINNPNQDEDIKTTLLDLIKDGSIENAIEIIQIAITNDYFQDKCFLFLANKLFENQHTKNALKLTGMISEKKLQHEAAKIAEKELSKISSIQEIITVVNAIQNKDFKNTLFIKIVEELMKKGSFDNAIEIFNEISNENDKIEVLPGILEKLIKNNHSEKAIEIINTIFNENKHKKDEFISLTVEILIENKQTQKAINIANIISDKTYKGWAFIKIVEELLQNKQTEKAIRIANTISDKTSKENAFVKIVDRLLKNLRINKAKEITNIISNETLKGQASVKIVRKLLEHDEIEEAIKITNAISNETYKGEASVEIIEKLLENNRVEEAIEIINTISDEVSHSEASVKIVKKLLEINHVEKAIEITDAISDEDCKDDALAKIVKKLLKDNLVDKARERANEISDPYTKNITLQLFKENS